MANPSSAPASAPRHRRGPGPRDRRSRLRRTIAWVASCLVFVLLLGGGYVAYNYAHFSASVHRVAGALPAKHKNAARTADPAAQNILLIGTDQRPPGMTAAQYRELATTPDDGSINTDTMILLHIPGNGASATLVSFPRDSYVSIPGFGKNKINAAYAFGYNAASGSATQKDAAGVKLLASTIENLTGLTIDHYVKVSLLSFYNIANALGPVQVCLKNPVDDPYSGAHFPAGPQSLNATQALEFVRQRHGLPNGDFDRAIRQQYFLTVEAQHILSAGTLLNPVKLNNVLGVVGNSLEMDQGLNLLQLAGQLKNLKGAGIHSATVPMANPATSTVEIDGQPSDVDDIDYDALPDFIATITGQPTAAGRVAKATAASPGSVSVDVLNGAGTARGATTASATLAAAGFQTGTPADAPQLRRTTTIYVPAGGANAADAKAVAAYLPGAAIVGTNQYQHVTVVLGTDGIMPTPPGAAGASPTAPATPAAPQPSAASVPTPSATPSAPTTSYSAATCIN